MVRIALVDDHPLFRAGLVASLRSEPDLHVVGEACTAEQALALVRSSHVDVAIIDVLMPGVSGITLAHDLRDAAPSCLVIGLSSIDEPGLIADMLRAGAHGYVLKTQPREELVEAIRHVAGGVRYLPPMVSREHVERELATETQEPLGRLTKREREIFELLIRGYSNGDIAARLFISLRTVETHRQRITKKLSARAVTQLQRLAARQGGL